MKYHALRRGTSLPLCGHHGEIADDEHPVECKRCLQQLSGGYGTTRSKSFNFPLNQAKWDAIKRAGR